MLGCFDSSPHVFVNLIVSPPSLFLCSLAILFLTWFSLSTVLPLYNSLCFSVRCQTVVVFSACTDCIVLLTSRFVLSGSSARCCFLCFSASPSVRPVTVGFHLYTCHSGLSTDSLRTVQPIARNCEQLTSFIASAAVRLVLPW